MFDVNNLDVGTWYLMRDNREVFLDGLSHMKDIVYLYDPNVTTNSGLYTQNTDDFCAEVVNCRVCTPTGFRFIQRFNSKTKSQDTPSEHDLMFNTGTRQWVTPTSPHTKYDDHIVYATREDGWVNLETLSRNEKAKIIGNICCINTLSSERAYFDEVAAQYRFVGFTPELTAVIYQHAKQFSVEFSPYYYKDIDVYIPPKLTPCKKKPTKKK